MPRAKQEHVALQGRTDARSFFYQENYFDEKESPWSNTTQLNEVVVYMTGKLRSFNLQSKNVVNKTRTLVQL